MDRCRAYAGPRGSVSQKVPKAPTACISAGARISAFVSVQGSYLESLKQSPVPHLPDGEYSLTAYIQAEPSSTASPGPQAAGAAPQGRVRITRADLLEVVASAGADVAGSPGADVAGSSGADVAGSSGADVAGSSGADVDASVPMQTVQRRARSPGASLAGVSAVGPGRSADPSIDVSLPVRWVGAT
jgi:hypothetical protein